MSKATLTPEARKVTKRLIVSLIGCAMVWYFLNTHREWVWAYFASMMTMQNPSPALAAVAEKSIAAITTIAITGITSISAIVIWFVTGNVVALSSMFKFASIGNSAASVASDTVSEFRQEKREDVQRIIHEAEEKYQDDPSYRPIETDTSEVFR